MSLFPFAGAHAVQSAAFALEWPVELSDSEMSAIAIAHDKLKASLPASSPIQTLTFQLIGNQPGVANTAPSGYLFSRPGGNGAARMLEVQKNRLIGQINDYTRWESVWKEVKGWFDVVGPILGDKRQITHVGLQYNDVFYWRDKPETLDLSAVFRTDSPLLPPGVFKQTGLWHSHHGYLLDQTSPTPHRLLENVNVNMLEELGQRSILITTVHKAEFPELVGWQNLTTCLDELMAELHKRNKAILTDLLSVEAADKISLNKGSK